MRRFKRILAWMAAVATVLTVLPLSAAAAQTVDYSAYGRSILARMDNAEALLYVYGVLEEAVDGTPANILITHETHKVTWEELCTVYDLVLSDHPEIFWHGSRYSGSIRGDGYAAALKPTYTMNGSALETAKAAVEAEVVRLTADLEGKSDYEKSILLHDRLAAETEYVMQGEHQTVYGALVQGTAVCAGYARAYQLLMQRVGIPAWYVTGSSVSPYGSVVAHAWNLVQLDGEWYYTDVTWDDQQNYTFYAYLNNTTAQITEDHTVGNYAAYLPTATATACNYFVRNDRQMQTMNVAAVADIIRTDFPARVYVTGDKAAFIKAYGTYLFDICDALGVPAGSISYGNASLGREVILRLDVEHTCRYALHTVPATCGSDGYSVEICSYDFCHNEQNRTVLPATGTHVYDNACDDTCNGCGLTRTPADHIYDNACDADCNECGARRQAPEHTYFAAVLTPATCGTAGVMVYTCSNCLDTYTADIPATGDHSYTNVCDPDCNLCGAVRQVAGHTYDNACDADCNECGAERETEGHVYQYPCSAYCRECGALRQEEAVHDHRETVITPATCGKEGQSRFTCSYCGDSFTMITPMTLQHVYDHDCDSECNVCSATRWVEGHVYDNDCDAACNTCGSVREVGDHIYDTPCDSDCNLCGAVRTAPHAYSGDDDAACDLCGASRPTHIPGDVTGDGKVNVRDLGLLQQYLNGFDVTIVEAAADVTGDGKINVRDLGLLQQYLNGFDVVLK